MKRKALLLINLVLALLMVFSSVCFAFTSVPVKSISLNKTSLTLAVGKTATLTALISPANATNKAVTWSTSDNKIAKVSTKGVVTAVKAGKATITARSADGKAIAKCVVTISKAAKENNLPVVDIVYMNFAIPGLDNVAGMKNDRILKYIQEKLNINLKIKTTFFDDYGQKLQLALAAGNAPDLFALRKGGSSNSIEKDTFNKGVNEDLFVDMGSIVFKNPERYKVLDMLFQDPVWKLFNDIETGNANKYISIHSIESVKSPLGGPLFNMRYLRKLGLSLPTTVDEFINILRAIKKNYPDVIPYCYNTYAGVNYFEGIEQLFFSTNGVGLITMIPDKDGYFHDYSTSDKTRAIVKQIAALYKEGLIDKAVMTKQPYANVDDLASGKTAVITLFSPNVGTGQYDYAFGKYKANFKDATYKDLMYPEHPLKGSEGSEVTYGSPTGSGYDLVIPKTSKNPERVLDFANYVLSDEGQNAIWYGVEGVHYTKDSSGNIKLNLKEYLKDTAVIYYKNEPNRADWAPLSSCISGGSVYIQYEKSKGFLEGINNSKNLIEERKPASPETQYARNIYQTWKKEGYVSYPPYTGFASISDAENKIYWKIWDVKTKWFVPFLIGEKDVDKEWDNFVKEAKDAGIVEYEKAYNLRIKEAKKKYDMCVQK